MNQKTRIILVLLTLLALAISSIAWWANVEFVASIAADRVEGRQHEEPVLDVVTAPATTGERRISVDTVPTVDDLTAQIATLFDQLDARDDTIDRLQRELAQLRAETLAAGFAEVDETADPLTSLLREVGEGDKWIKPDQIPVLLRAIGPQATYDALACVDAFEADLHRVWSEARSSRTPDEYRAWRRNELPAIAREKSRETIGRLSLLDVPSYIADQLHGRVADLYPQR